MQVLCNYPYNTIAMNYVNPLASLGGPMSTAHTQSHNPCILAYGQQTSLSCDGLASLIHDGTHGIDLINSNDAMTFLRHILVHVLEFSVNTSEDWVSIAYNWISKSRALMANHGQYVMHAIQDAIRLCSVREIMINTWLCVPMMPAVQHRIDKVRRFKTQVIKAYQTHIGTASYQIPAETFRSCLGQSSSSMPTPTYASTPWMEFTPNLCFVYIPSLQILEIDLTLYTQMIPSSVSAANAVMPVPLEGIHHGNMDMNYSLEVATFSHCMGIFMLGDEDNLVKAIRGVRFKVSAMTWAKMLPDHTIYAKDSEWHHIDIDDAMHLHDLQISCPLSACILPLIDSTIGTCNMYLKVYRSLRDVIDGKTHASPESLDELVESIRPKARDLSQPWRSSLTHA